jgi:hypothetical protein
MSNRPGGRFSKPLLTRASHHMVRDSYQQLEVYHEKATAPFTTFQARIALATSGVTGRLQQKVQGDSAAVWHYMAAPTNAGIDQGDIVWRGAERFRVVATDENGHETQVLLQALQ